MLTQKQHELLMFIHERLKEAGVPPSFDEMKDALDLRSKSGIHRLIRALEERGFIKRLPNRARAIEIVRLPESTTPAALHHCGRDPGVPRRHSWPDRVAWHAADPGLLRRSRLGRFLALQHRAPRRQLPRSPFTAIKKANAALGYM